MIKVMGALHVDDEHGKEEDADCTAKRNEKLLPDVGCDHLHQRDIKCQARVCWNLSPDALLAASKFAVACDQSPLAGAHGHETQVASRAKELPHPYRHFPHARLIELPCGTILRRINEHCPIVKL